MKKIFAALFVSCLVAAAAATAQTTCDDFQNTQAFKGTITMKVNWENNGSDTNCDAWDNNNGKLDFYMVLCYAPVICPICPVEVFQAHQWVVNRNVSPIEIFEIDMTDYTDMIDLGAGSIAVLTDLYYLNADPYLALVGKRTDKFFCTGDVLGPVYKTTIKSLETYFGDWTTETYTSNSDYEVCTEGDEIVYGTVSLSPFKTVVPKVDRPDCPTCPYDIPEFDCDGIIEQINAFLDRKYPAAERTLD